MVIAPGMLFRLTTMITLTAGTAFIMWLSEQISEKGIGNGMSIIIFAGIIARMPQVLVSTLALSRTGELSPIAVIVLLAFCLATIAAIVYVERSHRKVPVHYPRRAGKGGQQEVTPQQHMPLKVNMSGVLPPIFAYAIMFMPATIGNFVQNETIQDAMVYLSPGNPVYYAILVGLILVCTFYCTQVVYNPEEVSENLKKNGAFIPTVRPCLLYTSPSPRD